MVHRSHRRGSRLRRLVFAFAPPADAFPSALLRGEQLMEIARAVSSEIECHATTLGDLWQRRDEWVVLTKSALLASDRDDIPRLHALGHRLIADFIDLAIDTDIAASVDVLLASSFSQYRFFRNWFPQVMTLHLTHHVDLRMPAISTPADWARFGYFGRLANCLHAEKIADLVRLVEPNDVFDTSWMARLFESNVHYAIRAAEEPCVFKPFLKGFVAAHCGVPIILAAADAEARHYLGDDYPFVVEDLSLRSVRRPIKLFANQYATSTWKSVVERLKEIAAQSNRRHVEEELRAVLDAIW